jgi:hypothetical protein
MTAPDEHNAVVLFVASEAHNFASDISLTQEDMRIHLCWKLRTTPAETVENLRVPLSPFMLCLIDVRW